MALSRKVNQPLRKTKINNSSGFFFIIGTLKTSSLLSLLSLYFSLFIVVERGGKGDRLNYKNQPVSPFLNLLSNRIAFAYGAVMAVASKVTAVCANALPFILAPVFSEISV